MGLTPKKVLGAAMAYTDSVAFEAGAIPPSMITDLQNQDTALWQATNNLENKLTAATKVSAVRSGADYGGIQLHCVNTGNVYSYFTGEVLLSSAIEIPPGEQYVFADENDFPELALYQGVGLLETGHALTVDMSAGTITYNPLLVLVANSIGIMNISTSEPLIVPASTLFTFNKILVLGEST